MEKLLAVEIVERACRCCLQPFEPSNISHSEVTVNLQMVFLDLINYELDDGSICLRCKDHLEMFESFKKEILMCRHNQRQELLDSQLDWCEEDVKEEESDEIFEEHVDADADAVNTEESLSINDLDDQSSRKSRINRQSRVKMDKEEKGSKLKKLLEKYDVQFLENDTGRTTKSPKIICPICSKILTVLSFPVHLLGHEGGRDYNFMCEVCSKRCISNSELTVHRRRHTKEKPFQCDQCPKRFFNCKKNLIQHLRNIHLNRIKVKQNLEQCHICLKKFAQDYLTHHHMKTAHPNGIDDGVKVNPETDHYHCDTCSGQYRTRRYFDNHVCITGANDGPTQSNCCCCSVKFSSRFETIKHIQEVHATRLDETRWKCLVCEKIVLDKIVLHVESVHTPRSSKCGFCGKELKNRRCLRNHIYVVHQNGSEIRKQKRKTKKLMSSVKLPSI